MKAVLWTVCFMLASLLVAPADNITFWRVLSSQTNTMTGMDPSGTLTWSNSVAGEEAQVQRATSLAQENWQDYIKVPTTGMTASVWVVDPNPPVGMVLIPAGSFVMGATTNVGHESYTGEFPQHTVNLSAFYIDAYEVTKALWDHVYTWATNTANGYTFGSAGSGKATHHPVHTVNWYDVVKWCNARSQQDGVTPVYYTDAGFATVYKTGEIAPFANWAANGYRLPTEAEWEKAARGGEANTRFPWTDYTNKISWAKANYYGWSEFYGYDLSGGSGAFHPTFETGGFPYTSPVGAFAANGYGLYDMAGNVFELCWDWYGGTYYSTSASSDPRGPVTGEFGTRVMRGGQWGNVVRYARCASRGNSSPDEANSTVGFRCARGL